MLDVWINGKSIAQDSITDFDGNVYHSIEIGTQVWMKENMKSLHYSDGTEIPGVVAYNNSDSMANIYGRLYPWNAAMKSSTTPGSQGVCPDDWHIPTNAEWIVMDNYLGGSSVAGGKLKEEGLDHWLPPNTGATNSSGFTGLPAGEFDANQSQNFLFLGRAAVFWTSNQNGALMAIERYLSHDDAVSGQLSWYKTMKYSIRCIRDAGTGDHSTRNDGDRNIMVGNPFTNELIIDLPVALTGKIALYDLTGKKILEETTDKDLQRKIIGTSRLQVGMYLLEILTFPSNRVGGHSSGIPQRKIFKCYKIEKP